MLDKKCNFAPCISTSKIDEEAPWEFCQKGSLGPDVKKCSSLLYTYNLFEKPNKKNV